LVRHIAKMKKVYRSRLEALEECLEKDMPEETGWTHTEGGMCLWLTLPPGFDAAEFLIHGRERGVLFVPGSYFYSQHPQPNTLRLGFASLDEDNITRGIRILAETLKQEIRKRHRGANGAAHARVALI
jgi:DNA-binding transcriptional MocR family regulator